MGKFNDSEVVQPVKGSKSVFDVVWNEKPGQCRDCGEEVGFGKTKRDKWVLFNLPCDPSEPAVIHWDTCPTKGAP